MLVVGQKLWYVPDRRGTPYEVEVTKVGRKWATLGEGYRKERVDLETLVVDGGEYSSPGKCYLSREEYEAKRNLQEAWADMYQRMCHSPPSGATLENIKKTRELWGL